MKIELETPYEIGEELYWMYKGKITKSKVKKFVCFNLGTDNTIKIDMVRPDCTIITEILDFDKVFKTKEELIEAIST